MEMNVTTKKMPAMRARFLASACSGRSGAADADPFREDLDLLTSVVESADITSILSFDPDTYGVSMCRPEGIYLPCKFVKRAGTRSTLAAPPRSTLASDHEDQEARKTPNAHQRARAANGRRIRRRARSQGSDDAQPRQRARRRGPVAL